MGLSVNSRFRWCDINTSAQGIRSLGERPKYLYRDLKDNRVHTVRSGDRLWFLAQIYFAGMPRAGALYWVIADFQPTPILDPTIELSPGSTLIVPSLRTLQTKILVSGREKELG